MTLKQKTVTGLIWSFVDNIASLGISFVIGVILARILSPTDFGLVGMLSIFIAISQSFIDSGFRQSLIRKQHCTAADYATVFYFSLIVGFLFYFLLFISANWIGRFFNEPMLKDLIRVLALGLIINALSTIQNVILTKKIDFKLQAKISVIAAISSGIISIYMAYSGFGVWSLVVLTLVKYGVNTFLLFVWCRWWPTVAFSLNSLKELFSFGSKLLISGLIDTLYRNIYYIVIGKYFTAKELGFYTRADQFQSLPSSNIQNIIGRVSFPVLLTIQNDIPRLREAYTKIIRSTMLITFVLMLGMVAVARPMIYTLIGAKWEPSVIYLQMLCMIGMFYPLHAINLNMLEVQGRSDLFLHLEIIKKMLAIPIVILGVFYGIKIMIIGMMVNTMIAYYLNSYWSGRFIGYPFYKQLRDILPSFLLATVMSIVVYTEGQLLPLPMLYILIIQLLTGALITIGLCEIFHFNDYLYIKEIVKDKLKFTRK